MVGTADVKPLVRHLATASGWPEAEIRERLHPGRLQRLRHAVVHEGMLDEVLEPAVDHVRALVLDAVRGCWALRG